MQKLKILFCEPEFQAFIACLVLVIFSWPILTILESMRNGFVFYYFFVAWVIVIIFLMLIAIGHRLLESGKTSDSEPKD
jgi:hypothetical protein